MAGHKIKLQSSDGDTFDVEVDIAKQSATIKTMLEDLGMDEEEDVIPLPNVNSAILKKVKIFLRWMMNLMIEIRLFNGQLIIKMIHHHRKMMKIVRRIPMIFHHGIKIFLKLIKEHFLN